jgi:hypothetical protein
MDFAEEKAHEEVSALPREPARATHWRPKSPPNHPLHAARRRAPLVHEILAYEWSLAKGAILALAGRAGEAKVEPNTRLSTFGRS